MLAGFYNISWCNDDTHFLRRSVFFPVCQKNVLLHVRRAIPDEFSVSHPALCNGSARSRKESTQPPERVVNERNSGLLFASCTTKQRPSAFLHPVYPLSVTLYSVAMEILKTSYNAQHQAPKQQAVTRPTAFNQVLAKEVTSQQQPSVTHQSPATLMEVGTITNEIPTVSELLFAHDKLKSTAWEILADSKNQNKEYTTIRPGTKIYLDKQTGALSWSGESSTQAVMGSAASLARGTDKMAPEPGEQIPLGVINRTTPTVSHLLHNDPRFHNQTWEIVNLPINADKAFHNMATGSEVILNPATMEITWNKSNQTPTPMEQPVVTGANKEIRPSGTLNSFSPSTDLSQAVQPYMGKSYQELDCYELLVNGLKQLDIPYGGRNGLYSRLTQMALDRGLPANAYLNGEGIVEIAGATVLTKNYTELDNWQQDSTKLVSEIQPLLNSGQILSFSTQTRGHTGIISRQEEEWTYINSGRLDNAIEKNDISRGVGEELLDNEIHNWFKLAHSRGESLKITLGELSQEKLRTIAKVGQLPENRI